MPARLRLALFVTGLLAVTAVAGVLLFAVGEKTVAAAGFAGSLRPSGIPPADFGGVRDERGAPLRLAAMRGKPVVVTFLYTTCRDTCPLTAQQIRIALDELGHDVPVVAVSVDPANDTPARARTFALKQSMQGRMRWALGSERELQPGCGTRTSSQPQTRRRGAHRLDDPARRARRAARRLRDERAHARRSRPRHRAARARGGRGRLTGAAPGGLRPAAAASAAGAPRARRS